MFWYPDIQLTRIETLHLRSVNMTEDLLLRILKVPLNPDPCFLTGQLTPNLTCLDMASTDLTNTTLQCLPALCPKIAHLGLRMVHGLNPVLSSLL